ncbi:MAG: hypothetical protein LBJ74_01245 [Heliobacteriaceae bacterium]|jgi:hypothetical protein|nr:hypothetical protein [Heliobacteriaceae bacterium]
MKIQSLNVNHGNTNLQNNPNNPNNPSFGLKFDKNFVNKVVDKIGHDDTISLLTEKSKMSGVDDVLGLIIENNSFFYTLESKVFGTKGKLYHTNYDSHPSQRLRAFNEQYYAELLAKCIDNSIPEFYELVSKDYSGPVKFDNAIPKLKELLSQNYSEKVKNSIKTIINAIEDAPAKKSAKVNEASQRETKLAEFIA